MSEKPSFPFKTLGEKLKSIRQTLNETIEDVSGAVEIDRELLECIEKGMQRPEEDILLLLINHFGIKEEDAAVLWKLADYKKPLKLDREPFDESLDRNMVLVMAIDPRVIYSDTVQITANQQGVIFNFNQTNDGKRPITAARIGMSREQANNVLKALHQVLQYPKTRQLPPSTENNDKNPSQDQTK